MIERFLETLRTRGKSLRLNSSNNNVSPKNILVNSFIYGISDKKTVGSNNRLVNAHLKDEDMVFSKERVQTTGDPNLRSLRS